MPSKEFTIYKNSVAKGLSGDVSYYRKEKADKDFIEDRVKSFRGIRHAKTWKSLFQHMSDSGWTRDDVIEHAREYQREGKIKVGAVILARVRAGDADGMDT